MQRLYLVCRYCIWYADTVSGMQILYLVMQLGGVAVLLPSLASYGQCPPIVAVLPSLACPALDIPGGLSKTYSKLTIRQTNKTVLL